MITGLHTFILLCVNNAEAIPLRNKWVKSHHHPRLPLIVTTKVLIISASLTKHSNSKLCDVRNTMSLSLRLSLSLSFFFSQRIYERRRKKRGKKLFHFFWKYPLTESSTLLACSMHMRSDQWLQPTRLVSPLVTQTSASLQVKKCALFVHFCMKSFNAVIVSSKMLAVASKMLAVARHISLPREGEK